MFQKFSKALAKAKDKLSSDKYARKPNMNRTQYRQLEKANAMNLKMINDRVMEHAMQRKRMIDTVNMLNGANSMANSLVKSMFGSKFPAMNMFLKQKRQSLGPGVPMKFNASNMNAAKRAANMNNLNSKQSNFRNTIMSESRNMNTNAKRNRVELMKWYPFNVRTNSFY